MRTNHIPPAAFSFGQRVTCTWHEAECAPTQAVITGINYDHRRGGDKVRYTITEDDGSQTDDISEGMLSAAGTISAPEGVAIKTAFHGVIEAPKTVTWDQYTTALNAAGERWRKRLADVEAELAREVEAVAELNQRLIERQESNQAQLIRIEDGWRERLRESQAQVLVLREAHGAAKAFIESHAADPDLTEEMVTNYAVYQEKSAALSGPPAPVVAMEDVRLLVSAVKQCVQFQINLSLNEQNLVSAVKNIAAKYPTLTHPLT